MVKILAALVGLGIIAAAFVTTADSRPEPVAVFVPQTTPATPIIAAPPSLSVPPPDLSAFHAHANAGSGGTIKVNVYTMPRTMTFTFTGSSRPEMAFLTGVSIPCTWQYDLSPIGNNWYWQGNIQTPSGGITVVISFNSIHGPYDPAAVGPVPATLQVGICNGTLNGGTVDPSRWLVQAGVPAVATTTSQSPYQASGSFGSWQSPVAQPTFVLTGSLSFTITE